MSVRLNVVNIELPKHSKLLWTNIKGEAVVVSEIHNRFAY